MPQVSPSLGDLAHKIKEAWRVIEANVDPPDRDIGGYIHAEQRVKREYLKRHPNFTIDEKKLQSLLCGPL